MFIFVDTSLPMKLVHRIIEQYRSSALFMGVMHDNSKRFYRQTLAAKNLPRQHYRIVLFKKCKFILFPSIHALHGQDGKTSNSHAW